MSHDHDGPATPVSGTARLWLGIALVPFLLASVVGLVALWPSSHHFAAPPQYQSEDGSDIGYVHARVTALTDAPCTDEAADRTRCTTVHFEITSGSDRGESADVPMARGVGEPQLHMGDPVVLARARDKNGQPSYFFEDFARGTPLLALGIVFALLAIAIGRRRGLTALLGLLVVFAAIVEFLLPALLSGESPVLVALTTGSAVMIVVLYVSHGLSARTTVAVLGTLGGLVMVTAIGTAAVTGTSLTGLSSDDLTAVQVSAPQLKATGIILAGLVIGSLGVLNDVTVTQASAVWELHHANPLQGRLGLYAAAMRIGRDHMASTIYTLLLAYAGAALPVLLLFTQAAQPLGVVLNGDLVASDIVRSLTGAIGLLLAVPLTTGIAVLAVTQTDRRPRSSRTAPSDVAPAAEATTSWSAS